MIDPLFAVQGLTTAEPLCLPSSRPATDTSQAQRFLDLLQPRAAECEPQQQAPQGPAGAMEMQLLAGLLGPGTLDRGSEASDDE